jgi:hypothetical protein
MKNKKRVEKTAVLPEQPDKPSKIDKLLKVLSGAWVAGLLMLIVWIINKVSWYFPDVAMYAVGYVVFTFCIVFVSILVAKFNSIDTTKEELPAKNIARMGFFSVIGWDIHFNQRRGGYTDLIKNMLLPQIESLGMIKDDIKALLLNIKAFIEWFLISVLTVSGIMIYVRAILIRRAAKFLLKEQNEKTALVRREWPRYAELENYRQANENKRKHIKHNFKLMYRLPNVSVLDAMESIVLKGGK